MDPKTEIKKNFGVVTAAFVLLYSALNGLVNIQSSLNFTGGLGVGALSCIYAGATVSTFFAPTFTDKLGYKWMIAFATFCHCIFILLNFWSQFYTLLPGGIILGLGMSPLWLACAELVSDLAIQYAGMSNTGYFINLFQGLFSMGYESTQIWGNVVLNLVLRYYDDLKELPINKTLCGATFCPYKHDMISESNSTNATSNPSRAYIMLPGVYTLLGVLSMILVTLFLQNTEHTNKENDATVETEMSIKSTNSNTSAKNDDTPNEKVPLIQENFQRSLLKKTRELMKVMFQPLGALCIPIFIFYGFYQVWLFAEFNQSFTSCTLSLPKVGSTMILYGVTSTVMGRVMGFIMGRYYKYIPQLQLAFIVTAVVINVTVLIAMLLWRPSADQTWVFYLVPALWGVADALWNSQLTVFITVNFELLGHSESDLYTIWLLWERISCMVFYGASRFMCMNIKIYVGIALAILALIMFIIVQVKLQKLRDKQPNDVDIGDQEDK